MMIVDFGWLQQMLCYRSHVPLALGLQAEAQAQAAADADAKATT